MNGTVTGLEKEKNMPCFHKATLLNSEAAILQKI